MHRIINLVDSIDPINFGLWNSIIINQKELLNLGYTAELVFPRKESPLLGVTCVQLDKLSSREVGNFIKKRQLDPKKDVIVSHGLWNYPTKWGKAFSDLGFRWVFVPHGMLEPWPLKHKWLKKKVYFNLVEKFLINKADLIRAVSLPEAQNLKQLFPHKHVKFIPNGVDTSHTISDIPVGLTRYLFLSRLHKKKNIVGLVQAWRESNLDSNEGYELIIAGPDQGELVKLQPLIEKSTNIRYVGGVFGEDKEALFRASHFYVLPSFSEGLPSAVLEAMSFGLVPIITEGCNFPDVFDKQLGEMIAVDKESIRLVLEATSAWSHQELLDRRNKCRALIQKEYSLRTTTDQQVSNYFVGMVV